MVPLVAEEKVQILWVKVAFVLDSTCILACLVDYCNTRYFYKLSYEENDTFTVREKTGENERLESSRRISI